MSLSKSTLESNILSAFNETFNIIKGNVSGTPPLIPSPVANNLAKAYDDYVKSGSPKAGALSMATPGNLATLSSLMVQNMMTGWTPGLIAYWTPVNWVGPGFIPANPTVPAILSGIAAPLAATLATKSNREDAAKRIAAILHSYTVQITVITTTIPPGTVVAIVPIM